MNDTGPSTAGSPALQVNVPLALLAQAVTSEAGRLGESVAVHLGWEVAGSADPEARRLTALGAGFDWVAFAVPGTSIWNLHVVVPISRPSHHVAVHVPGPTDLLRTSERNLQNGFKAQFGA